MDAIDTSPEGVRAARQAAGLTQGEAARLVHLRRWQSWSEYETGKRRADPARVHLFMLLTGQMRAPKPGRPRP